ncbi:MAG: GNAT family N-acetyltransferase [Acidobacteriota bacterium]|nr:MAG: GNAT family N-acetyltransferase [Acidobacteriota bacterium]
MKTLPIETALARVLLRRVRSSDARTIFDLVNDPDVVRWTTRIPHPYPQGGAVRFIRKAQRDWRNGHAFILGIVLKEEGQLAGIISLSGISHRHGCAELGFWLGQRYWGQGLMTEAARGILQLGFETLQLNRIYASAFEQNHASRRVLEKCGFQVEGILREAVFRYDARQNYVNFGILRREHPPSARNNKS